MIETMEHLMRVLNITSNVALLILAGMALLYIRGVMRQEQRDRNHRKEK